jgi:hypothetical protein
MMMSMMKTDQRQQDDDDTRTAISVMSTMSCRELSIQRLQRRIASSSRVQQETKQVQELLKDLQEAQTRQKRLEQQLNQAGISIAEDIPYQEAKHQVAKIARQMQAIGDSQATHPDPKIQAQLRQDYYILEQQMEKYMKALELTDEYLQEQLEIERAWDAENFVENQRALVQVLKHMPVDFRQKSLDEWMQTPTPTGLLHIPKLFLLRFSRTNILTLLRMNPEWIRNSHPSNLEQRRVTGLTLTERRALDAYLQPIATTSWRNSKDPLTKRKWNWYCILLQNFKHHLASYEHHVSQYGSNEDDGSCCACPSKSKCPVRANQKLNYFLENYGYPCDLKNPQYETCDRQPSIAKTMKTNQTANTTRGRDPSRSNLLSEIAARAPTETMKRKVKQRASANAAKRDDNSSSSLLAELKARAPPKVP